MNTKLWYMYRDAANYKLHHSEVLDGELRDYELAIVNDEFAGKEFYPAEFGLPAPTFTSEGYSEYEDDPDCHEIVGFEVVDQPATVNLTILKFVEGLRNKANEQAEVQKIVDKIVGPLDYDTLYNAFRSYVLNDLEAADTGYVLDALQQAGLNNEQITELGFGDLLHDE